MLITLNHKSRDHQTYNRFALFYVGWKTKKKKHQNVTLKSENKLNAECWRR